MEKILVPTDFSANATNAIIYAVHFAHATNRNIVFFHATHADIPTAKAHDIYLKKVAKNVAEAVIELEKNIAKIYKKMHLVLNPNKVSFDVKFGHSAKNEIIEAALQHDVAMVIMSTQGATGLKKIFVGSNTTGVLQNVHCPVLAVPTKAKFKHIDTIGYSTDLEHIDAEVKEITPMIKNFNAQLSIFNVYPVYPIKVDYQTIDIETIVKRLKKDNVYEHISLTLIERKKENDLEGGMDEFIKKQKPDLLIMFSQSRNWFQKLINPSATETIALNPKVPLLSFKA